MKTIREVLQDHISGSWLDLDKLIAGLDARERERDAALGIVPPKPENLAAKAEPTLPTFEEWCAEIGFDPIRWYQTPLTVIGSLRYALLRKRMVRE